MKDKLSSRRGFTLTEMLMAVLLLALMTLVIGGGVTVVKNAYEKITLRAEADTLLSTIISAVEGELRTAGVIRIEEKPQADGQGKCDILGSMAFENKDRGYEAKFENGAAGSDTEGMICVRPTVGSQPQLPLLTDKTLTSKLKTEIKIFCPSGSLEKDENTGEVDIKPDEFYFIVEITIDAPGKDDFRSRVIKIRPVNIS